MILAPFRLVVSLLFRASYAVFHNPGWAVVGMSVLLSLLLTPLYVWIERRKNANRISEAPMQAEIDKIEAVYTGRERFFYTREIHRRYGYKPLTALIPVLGLLVQIPFLLAAYHYLAELPLFSGVPFLYIHDLSRPDTIARVAGIPVNLLAILMTLINLVSGWRYADPRKPKERLQYIAVALIFLVLLYRCASAVVLYWTLSQALSLVRSEVFFRRGGEPSPESWTLSPARREALAYGGLLLCMASALYCLVSAWLYPHPFSVSSRKVVSALWCDAVFVVLAAEVLASVLAAKTRNIPWMLYLPLKWSATVQALLISLVLLRKFTLCPIGESPVLLYFVKRWIPFQLAVSAGTLTALIPWIRWKNTPKTSSPSVSGEGFGSVAVAGSAYLLLTLFVWHPVLVLCSDPSSFSISIASLIWQGIRIVLSVMAISWCVWVFLLRKTIPIIIAYILLFFALVVLFNLFLRPIHFGTLQGGKLMAAESLVRPHGDFVLECALLCALAIAAFYAVRRLSSRLIATALITLNIIVAIQTIAKISKLHSFRPASLNTPDTNDAIVFSTNHNNILILMLDMVQGWSFHTIADNPDLAEKLPGFTFFPNTLSVSTMTCPSIPTLYAGPEFSPDKLNNIKGKTIIQKGRDALDTMARNVSNAGYNLAIYNPKLVFTSRWNAISPLYDRKTLSNVLGKSDTFTISSICTILWGNSILQASPLFVKPSIYNDGKWIVRPLENDHFVPYGDDHTFLEALPFLSQARQTERGSYVFLHTEVTHNPWGIPLSHGGFKEVDNKQILRWTMDRILSLFTWMRDHGVYDNTRVILVSDHGLINLTRNEWIPSEDPFFHRELWTTLGHDCESLSREWRIQSVNCLLCVKDYNDNFPLRIDNRLASNEDTVPMAMSSRITDVSDHFPSVRRTYLVAPRVGISFQTLDTLPIVAVFDVHDNLFDLRNWTRLESDKQ